MSNFTTVKLIFPFVFLLCFTLFILPENSAAAKKYVVQIAASKTPLDIKYFASENEIHDDISELKSDSWFHYVVGDFENLEAASHYATVLIEKTKLVNAFARLVDEDALQIISSQKDENSVQLEETEQTSGFSDSIQQQSAISENINEKEESKLSTKAETHITKRSFIHIFYNDDKLKEFKNDLINYGNNHIPYYLRKFYFIIIDISFQFPAIIFLIIFILFFIVNIIGVLLILNFTIKKKNQKTRYELIYSKMYEEALLSYIFGEINWEKVIVKLKKINRNRNRKILISILLNLHENLKGEVDKFVPEIFSKLGLFKDSIKAAKSSFTYKKVQGIRELTNLYTKGALEIVPGLINSSDDVVRAEAQMAFIRLNENNPFEFLSSLTKSFTRWTQLSAFYMFRLYQLPVPSFADYLYSKHPTVQNFCLQMITYFQQLENVSEVFNMLKSGKERTRFLSYKAINDLRLYDGRKLIKNRYWEETTKNKLEIIRAFKNIGNEKDFEFLERVIHSESVSLKIEACRSMYFMNSEGRERLTKLSNESFPELELFIAHVTDPRN